MTRRIGSTRGPVAFWAAAGVALLASHDAVFLAQVGPGQALVRALRGAGHDYWGLASLLLVLIGGAALTAALVRLHALRRTARALQAPPTPGPRRPYIKRWLATWARLLAVVAIGFVLQENVEHVIQHGHAPGLGAIIGPEYPLALPVIAAVTALAALVAAALTATEQALLRVIADAMRTPAPRAPRSLERPPMRLTIRRGSLMARAAAGRAPPWAFVSAT
ncbi:MAG: hypothetical protein ACRDFY_07955 [Candidatus Limnocylindria bacterium]